MDSLEHLQIFASFFVELCDNFLSAFIDSKDVERLAYLFCIDYFASDLEKTLSFANEEKHFQK